MTFLRMSTRERDRKTRSWTLPSGNRLIASVKGWSIETNWIRSRVSRDFAGRMLGFMQKWRT